MPLFDQFKQPCFDEASHAHHYNVGEVQCRPMHLKMRRGSVFLKGKYHQELERIPAEYLAGFVQRQEMPVALLRHCMQAMNTHPPGDARKKEFVHYSRL